MQGGGFRPRLDDLPQTVDGGSPEVVTLETTVERSAAEAEALGGGALVPALLGRHP